MTMYLLRDAVAAACETGEGGGAVRPRPPALGDRPLTRSGDTP